MDLRNAWCTSKDNHPDGWQLDELLPPRGARGEEISGGNSPEAVAWYKAFQVKCALAVAAGKWSGPEIYPLPS